MFGQSYYKHLNVSVFRTIKLRLFVPQNAVKCVSESLEIKNFLGRHVPRPP